MAENSPPLARTNPPATPDDLFARLAELGIETTTITHPPLYTVAQSREVRGEIPGGHCKSLFFKDKKGALWLVVTTEDRELDLKDLAGRMGAARLSFGKPDLLYEVLGITPGAVTPFAMINDSERRVRIVLDKRMVERHPLLNYHPLTNEATTAITTPDLLRFIEACGHGARIVDLGPEGGTGGGA